MSGAGEGIRKRLIQNGQQTKSTPGFHCFQHYVACTGQPLQAHGIDVLQLDVKDLKSISTAVQHIVTEAGTVQACMVFALCSSSCAVR